MGDTKKYLVMDRATGEIFKVDEEEFLRMHEQLNKLMDDQRNYISFCDTLESLIKFWTEEEKALFYAEINSHEELANDGEDYMYLDFSKTITDDGKIVFCLDNPQPKEVGE